MSSKAFYVQKTKRLHSRYSLSGNAVLLLKALDDFHVGIIDRAELGRIVRISRNNRKAVTEIITKCAAMMEKQPGEMKDCIALIQNCTEILGVADEPMEANSMPFLKFPKEIRTQIYKYYINYHLSGPLEISPSKTTCTSHCYAKTACPSQCYLPTALARTCKSVMNEFLEYVYSKETFSFGCTCDMYNQLQANKLLHSSICNIKVHWCGSKADLAFSILASCPSLKQIHVVISKATTSFLTRRQEEILAYFPTQRSTRLYDARGIDELLKLRGMTNVHVSHIPARQGLRRTDEERVGLNLLLINKLMGRRSDVSV